MDPFEETLANTPRRDLPPEWRDGIVAAAVHAEAEETIPSRRSYTVFTRIGMGAIAACWIATAIFHFSTPKEKTTSSTTLSENRIAPPVYPALALRGEWKTVWLELSGEQL